MSGEVAVSRRGRGSPAGPRMAEVSVAVGRYHVQWGFVMVNLSDEQSEKEELVSRFWDELAEMLRDDEPFAALWEADRHEVLRAWAALEENSRHRVVETYAAAIQDPEAGAAYGFGLAKLLRYRDLDDQAEALVA